MSDFRLKTFGLLAGLALAATPALAELEEARDLMEALKASLGEAEPEKGAAKRKPPKRAKRAAAPRKKKAAAKRVRKKK